MQTTLAQYNETKSQDAFALQNSKLLKVRLDAVTVQAKLGSMVAYQGEVKFEHAGSGGMGRMLKKAVTGEGWVLVQPSEGQVAAMTAGSGGGSGAGGIGGSIGGLLRG